MSLYEMSWCSSTLVEQMEVSFQFIGAGDRAVGLLSCLSLVALSITLTQQSYEGRDCGDDISFWSLS